MSWPSGAAGCWGRKAAPQRPRSKRKPRPEQAGVPLARFRPPSRQGVLGALVRPSLSDWLFAALLGWLFLAGSGWSALLADGDTGWHIRAGDFILNRGRLPSSDPFSFTRMGERWFAWEWLSDVLFAGCHRLAGLKGVVLLAGTVIAGYLTLLTRHMAWRAANALVALAFCLLGAGASGIHYLARPHIFTLLFLTASLWMVDADRRRPQPPWCGCSCRSRRLWVNLHGGIPGAAHLAGPAGGRDGQSRQSWKNAPGGRPGGARGGCWRCWRPARRRRWPIPTGSGCTGTWRSI